VAAVQQGQINFWLNFIYATSTLGFQISPEILCNPSLEPPRFEIASGYNLLSRQQSTTSALAEENWAIGLNDLQKYEAIFNSLGPVDGRLSGNQCRPVLLNSQLPKGILAKVRVYAVIFFMFL